MSETKKILVIDGDRAACALIAEVLGRKGFEVFSFADPDEGVAKAGEIRPDLVFISILLPGSNGLKISRAVHCVDGLQGTPVIMLISYPDELDPRYTSTIGIVDVALKPLDAGEILSKTASVLGDGIAPEEPRMSPGVPGPEEAEAASLDEEWMSFLEKGDGETVGPAVAVSETPQSDSYGPVREEGEAGPGDAVKEGAGSSGEGGAEEGHDAADAVSRDDTTDFLLAEDRERSVPWDEEESPEVSTEQQRRSMKKFLVVAAVVIVIAAGAGVFAYRFFQGHGSRIAAPVAKAPLKKAPVAGAKKNALPAEQRVAARAPRAETAASAAQSVPERVANKADAVTEKAKKGSYSVQVGAFHNEKNAAALIEKLKKKGYDAFVLNDAGRRVRRVLVGKFGSRSTAAVEAKRLLEREDLKTVIYRY